MSDEPQPRPDNNDDDYSRQLEEIIREQFGLEEGDVVVTEYDGVRMQNLIRELFFTPMVVVVCPTGVQFCMN